MAASFRARMALLVLALFVVVQVPTVYAFYYAVRQSAVGQAHAQLRSGGRIFQQAFDARGKRLLDAVQIVASDFGFKQAAATGDTATIRSVLYNHGHRVGADVAVLADLDGNIVASSDSTGQAMHIGDWGALIKRARKQQQLSAVSLIDGKPYQLVIVPVMAPTHIGWVGMGFALNTALAARLHDLSALGVSFVVGQGPQRVVASTLPIVQQRQLAAALRDGARIERRQPYSNNLNGKEYLTLWQPLTGSDGALRSSGVGVVLQFPLAHALAPFNALKHVLLVIALLSLMALLIGAMALARNVTRPLSRLAAAARRVERGDYVGNIGVERGDELGELATAFGNMQRGIARRESKIAHQAFHDHLTGLPNRMSLQDRLQQAIERAQREGNTLGVLMLDIDHFKEINDTMGHGIGDRVLVELGQRLRQGVRNNDTAARFGGDEFVVLMEGAGNPETLQQRARELHKMLTKPLTVDALEFYPSVSIGLSLYPGHGDTPDDLLRRADIAMYDAKQDDARLRVYAAGRDAQHLYRLSLMQDLRRAIPNNELVLYYQPKLSLRSKQITHVEALLRWNHPQHGLIPPDDFIPLAEHSGGIRALTAWVMRNAIRQCALWSERGLDLGVALNLSALDVSSGDLPTRLAALLEEYGVDAERLILEVTETAVMRDAKHSLTVLTRLKACGVYLSIDDFGTGYSSLSHLKRLPVDELKIDQSFVTDMASDSEDATIVRSTIELAHNMGLRVAAEGVEDDAALAMLRDYQCDMAQGYRISRPMPETQLRAWLAQRQA